MAQVDRHYALKVDWRELEIIINALSAVSPNNQPSAQLTLRDSIMLGTQIDPLDTEVHRYQEIAHRNHMGIQHT